MSLSGVQRLVKRVPFDWPLALLLVAALGLRVFGVGFELPYLYHPDEDALVMPALNILKTGDWAPTRMDYGTLHIYLLTVVFAAVYALLARNGRIVTIDQLPLFERGTIPAVYQFPEFFLVARMVSALMGTVFVLVVYMLGARLGNRRVGLMAAAIAAFLPALVVNGHFATADTPLMFWITLALYLLLRAYDEWDGDSGWAYAGAGFVCGLAASTKYNGIVLAAPLLLASLLRVRSLDETLRLRVLGGPLAMAVGFVVGTPYALLNIPEFLNWLGYVLHLYNVPGQSVAMPVWLWHLRHHVTSPHVAVMVLAMVGFVLSFRAWGVKRAAIVASFAVLLAAAIVGQTNAQARMWLPAAGVVFLWAAVALDGLMQWVGAWLQGRRRDRRWAYALLLLLFVPLAYFSLRYDVNFLRDDVRTRAREWITVHIPAGTPLAVDYFHPQLDPEVWPQTRNFAIHDQTHAWYVEQGVAYIVLNEVLNDFAQQPPEAEARYQELMAHLCEVGSVRGPFLAATMVDIKIYRLEGCGEGEG